MRLRTFRVGTPREPDEGLRIAVTRRPPRGIPKAKWRSEGMFDVWFPALAPSAALIEKYRAGIDDPKTRTRFFDAYEREVMGSAESRQMLALFTELASRSPVSIGCFCEDESRCHRSRLLRMLRTAAKET